MTYEELEAMQRAFNDANERIEDVVGEDGTAPMNVGWRVLFMRSVERGRGRNRRTVGAEIRFARGSWGGEGFWVNYDLDSESGSFNVDIPLASTAVRLWNQFLGDRARTVAPAVAVNQMSRMELLLG